MNTNLNVDNYENALISKDLKTVLNDLKVISGNTMDLNIMEVLIGEHKCAVVSMEAMVSTANLAELVFRPLMNYKKPGYADAKDIYKFLTMESLLSVERKVLANYGDVFLKLFSGFVLVFVDGLDKAVSYSIQGFATRSVDEPTSEQNVKGAHDGFVETIRTNISLIRRRLKTAKLIFEMSQIGEDSKTDVCIAYLVDKTPQNVIDDIKKRLSEIKLDTIMSSGFIEPFLENNNSSLFTNVLSTDRPDAFCSKLNEGRVGILIDGTPFALIVPALFIENFQTVDDYINKPIYATYIRYIKYLAFFLAIALPGVFVAIVDFHTEMLTKKFLLNLTASKLVTPYSFFTECIIITIMYEIMREAGIRLPKTVGGAVSIVGALIIGDAAVSGSLISAPLLIIIGLTATSSFVIPNLNQQTSILRIVFIIAGGIAGLFGVSICMIYVFVNLSSIMGYGVPYNAPISPFTKQAMRDVLYRPKMKKLEMTKTTVEKLNGAKK